MLRNELWSINQCSILCVWSFFLQGSRRFKGTKRIKKKKARYSPLPKVQWPKDKLCNCFETLVRLIIFNYFRVSHCAIPYVTYDINTINSEKEMTRSIDLFVDVLYN